MNSQIFMDGFHFPNNSVYTVTTSNLNPFALQPHFIYPGLTAQKSVYQHFSVFYFPNAPVYIEINEKTVVYPTS